MLKLNSIKYHISLGLFCKIVLLLNEVNLDLKKNNMYYSFILNDFRKLLGFFKSECMSSLSHEPHVNMIILSCINCDALVRNLVWEENPKKSSLWIIHTQPVQIHSVIFLPWKFFINLLYEIGLDHFAMEHWPLWLGLLQYVLAAYSSP